MKKLLTMLVLLVSTQLHAELREVLLFNGKEFDPSTKSFKTGNHMDLHINKKEIVLTIDDGPNPGVTQAMLQILREYNIRATFFCLGANAAKYPDIMHETQADGHIVGNHSRTHANLTTLGEAWQSRLYDEVVGTFHVLKPFMFMSKKYYFRAPGGNWNPTLAQFLNEDPIGTKYIGPLLWDVGGTLERNSKKEPIKGADWACWSNRWTVDECLQGYVTETESMKGGVVLIHDLRMQSAELLRRYIQTMLDKGYKFVSLDDVKLKSTFR